MNISGHLKKEYRFWWNCVSYVLVYLATIFFKLNETALAVLIIISFFSFFFKYPHKRSLASTNPSDDLNLEFLEIILLPEIPQLHWLLRWYEQSYGGMSGGSVPLKPNVWVIFNSWVRYSFDHNSHENLQFCVFTNPLRWKWSQSLIKAGLKIAVIF